MEIMSGVHQLPLVYKNRPLQLYLLRFGDQSLLMDVGDAATPAGQIVPALQKIGVEPASVTYVLLTHPDMDHVGGIHAMKQIAPDAQFVCGAADREQIETPEGLARYRGRAHLHFHGLGPDDRQIAAFIENAGGAGKRLAMARTFQEGEILKLGDREVQILHLPGHSLGHLGVYLPWENAAIVGDAVQHVMTPFMDGSPALPPTYIWVDAYLGTLARLKAMRLGRLYSCHWPNCADVAAVDRFLDESREYVERAEQGVLETLREGGDAGMTLREVCLRAKPRLGTWPADRDLDARSMVCGHLQRLANIGLVRLNDERPTRYFFEKDWHGLR